MFRFSVNALLIIIGFAFAGQAEAGGLPATPSPVILKAAVDAKKNAIVVSGQNFGSTQPTVKLAGQILEVKRYSENEVVASLPRDIQPATYHLTVGAGGRDRAISNAFIAVVFPSRASDL